MKGYMTTKAAAERIGVAQSTLRRWQYDDRLVAGAMKPIHRRIGGRIFYKENDIVEFLAGRVAMGVTNAVTIK